MRLKTVCLLVLITIGSCQIKDIPKKNLHKSEVSKVQWKLEDNSTVSIKIIDLFCDEPLKTFIAGSKNKVSELNLFVTKKSKGYQLKDKDNGVILNVKDGLELLSILVKGSREKINWQDIHQKKDLIEVCNPIDLDCPNLSAKFKNNKCIEVRNYIGTSGAWKFIITHKHQ